VFRGLQTHKEAAMRYRVYSGPHGSGDFRAVEKDRMLFKEFSSLDEAMRWAKHLDSTGHTALLIEGDDGSRLDKREIAAALRHCETEASGAGHPI
jgi:hypothetical protein